LTEIVKITDALILMLALLEKQTIRNRIIIEESAEGERQQRQSQPLECARHDNGHQRQQQPDNRMRRSLQTLSHVQYTGQ
jgi:hypothetical protein